MPKIFDSWTVLPHGRLTPVDEGIWTVTGRIEMPLTHLERRMTVVRLKGRRLIIYSAIALHEAQMQVLESFGEPAFLIVPGDHHRTDAKVWQARYPTIQVVAPVGAVKAAEEAVFVDTTAPDFGDGDVSFVPVEGLSGHEAALLVRRPGGTTLIVNDLIGNMPRGAGFVLRLMGFAGDEPHVPVPVKMGLGRHRDELRRQLLAWADQPGLKRIIMSHGDPVEVAPAEALRRLAESLG